MLLDRKCSKCGHVEIDCYERPGYYVAEYVVCPVCNEPSFKRQFTAPSVICISGEGTSALEFANELDKRRMNASNGHGNVQLKDY